MPTIRQLESAEPAVQIPIGVDNLRELIHFAQSCHEALQDRGEHDPDIAIPSAVEQAANTLRPAEPDRVRGTDVERAAYHRSYVQFCDFMASIVRCDEAKSVHRRLAAEHADAAHDYE